MSRLKAEGNDYLSIWDFRWTQTEPLKEYLPDIKGLDGNDPSLMGVLISHPHLDHFGLLTHISEKIPVGIGAAARRILKAARPFLPGNWPIPAEGWNFRSGQPLEIGPFSVTPFLIDHSAYDSYALQIKSEEECVFYSWDFRNHGRKTALFERMTKSQKNVDTLFW